MAGPRRIAPGLLFASLVSVVSLGAAAEQATSEPKPHTEKPSEPAPKAEAQPKSEASPKSDAPPKKTPEKAKKSETDPKKAPATEPAKKANGAKATSSKSEAPPKPGTLPAVAADLEAVPAEPEAAPDPRRGAGTRSVAPLKASEAAAREERLKAAEPQKPAATLPPGSRPGEPNKAARRRIADGATDEDLRAGKDDPELSSLRAAERVLFPRPLVGIEPGWSWELPRPLDSRGAEIIDSGVPPAPRVEAQRDVFEAAKDAEWLRGLALPSFPVRLDEYVIKYLRFYRDSSQGRAIIKAWAKKSGRFAAALKSELGKSGLPIDLVWLSLIESGHNPTIVSPAGAAGLWQFMPDAGRTYGLAVDRWVDERLDPQRSTEAATRYLSDLYRRFGSWELAMAGYNMGYGGLARAIRKFNTNDFWDLARYEAGIPWETTLYVPKIMAIAIVMNNRKAFAIDSIAADPPDTFDVVLVGPGVPLDAIARAAGVSLTTIQELNPQYLAGRTPPWVQGTPKPSWRVRVPAGKGVSSSSALAQNSAVDDAVEPYVVRFGDTVEAIAALRGTTEARLRALNHVEPKEVLSAGTILLVPRSSERAVTADDEVVVVPPRNFNFPDKKRVFYRVLSGDTLGQIAGAFGVSSAEITDWNALDARARLQSGMVLQLFVDKRRDLRGVRYLDSEGVKLLVAGSSEFYDYFEGQNGKKRVVITAREGDTLASLARRHAMTIGAMERINRRSRSDRLRAGESLVVYVDRGRAMPKSPAQSAPDEAPATAAVEPPFPDSLPPASAVAATPSVTTGSAVAE